ncbi:MAG: ComEC/Rec2 family competence protein [Verrucomicrobia bacterium]|nr:ComEC/Rec2 family competence protein [Verrucomicrobiota bacterium]
MHRLFWRGNPALLLGVSLLLGTSSYLYLHSPLFPLLWLAYLFFVGPLHLFRGACFILFGIAYALFLYSGAPDGGRNIEGVFSISSLQPHQSPFQKGYLYKGTLRLPEAIPCTMSWSQDGRPSAQCDYWIRGRLEQRGPFQYSVKAKELKPLDNTWSLAEWRFRMKERFRTLLRNNLSPRAAALLSSLVTGDVEERSLRYEFNRVGLQHLLSISGFHFAVVILFCSGFLGLFLPERVKLWTLLIALTAYFLFVGSAPAVLRSFITAVLYLVGKLLRRQPAGINLLGCAILFETILDPLAGAHIGFQLSFVSCAGLLLLFPLYEKALQTFFPKRSLSELAAMTRLSPFGHLLSAFLRKGLATTLAVNTALLPLLLFHFHSFPLLSLLYNLFFPVCASLSIIALLASLIAYLIWAPLGHLLFTLTGFWTTQLLDLVAYPPLLLDRSLQFSHIPAAFCLLYLFALFLLLIHFRKRDFF